MNYYLFIVIAICFSPMVYGVSNADLPEMGHSEDSPLRNNLGLISPYTYKGIGFINDYGWGITLYQSLKQLEKEGKWYDVKCFHNEKLGFSLIKIDLGKDDERTTLPKLLRLAKPEDIKYYSHWVTSCALASDIDLINGKLSDDEESIKSYNKPLSCYSKIEKQENDLLYLGLGESMDKCYEDIWPQLRENLIKYYVINNDYIKGLSNSPEYKIKYLQNQIQILSHKKNLLDKDLADLKYKIDNLLDHKKEVEDLNLIKSIDFEICSFQKEIDLKQEKITHLSFIDEKKLWDSHVQKLELEENFNTMMFYKLRITSNISLKNKKNQIKDITDKYYKSFYNGVPDKEDGGGFICVPSKALFLQNDRYTYTMKFVGITCGNNNDNYSQGKENIAIDLTTNEVYDWIFETIDAYYTDKKIPNSDKGKRNVDDLGFKNNYKRPVKRGRS